MNVDQLIRVLKEYPPYFPVTDRDFHEFVQAWEVDRTDSRFPQSIEEDTVLMLK